VRSVCGWKPVSMSLLTMNQVSFDTHNKYLREAKEMWGEERMRMEASFRAEQVQYERELAATRQQLADERLLRESEACEAAARHEKALRYAYDSRTLFLCRKGLL